MIAHLQPVFRLPPPNFRPLLFNHSSSTTMASHSRSKSKGGFSILSIDTFRSCSRAGSRQANGDDIVRSPSSLLCNPHDQAPGTSEPQSPSTDLSGITVTQPELKRRRRPLSWLSLRGHRRFPRTMSVDLPKDQSSSTMVRSVISAPILTSTTNSKVADQEGVHCGDFRTDETTAAEARILAEKIQAEEAKTYLDNPPRRFLDILKDKLRRRQDFEKIDEGVPISRKRAETINLCKDKIKTLTGNGHVKRKSCVPDTMVEDHLLCHKESQAGPINQDHHCKDYQDQHLRQQDSKAALIHKTSHLGFDHQPDNEPHFGSLSRFFNSALEQLDFQTNTTSFLRSRSSVFNMKKPGETQEGLPSDNPWNPPYTPRPAHSQLPGHTNTNDPVDRLGMSRPESPKKTQVDRFDRAVLDLLHRGKTGERAQQTEFIREGYVPGKSYKNHPGGVNPLRMHQNITTMARVPSGVYSESEQVMGEQPTSDHTYGTIPPTETTETPGLTPTRPSRKVISDIIRVRGKSPKKTNVDLAKDGARRSSSPFMPATPSPLRFVNTRPGEKAKRYGMVGMPSPKVEKDDDAEESDQATR